MLIRNWGQNLGTAKPYLVPVLGPRGSVEIGGTCERRSRKMYESGTRGENMGTCVRAFGSGGEGYVKLT